MTINDNNSIAARPKLNNRTLSKPDKIENVTMEIKR
jgi:hypothetical protein